MTDILITFGLMLLGLVLLAGGGEFLVRGASRLARSLGISALVVGLTVVAFGTSAPELAVGIAATLEGRHDLLLGHVIGSNIANVLLVLGLAAATRAMRVALNLVKFDVPIMIFVVIAFMLIAFSGSITRFAGVGLMLALLAYTCFTYFLSKREGPFVEKEYEEGVQRTTKPVMDVVLVLVGMAALKFGADFIVLGAERIAEIFEISERIIGLTVVAIGTSLPEVATAVVAARRGQSDIAVGNIVGSNIFNILAVVGVTATVNPISVSPAILIQDGTVMVLATLLMLPILRTGQLVSRKEGFALLTAYAAYITWTILRPA